METCTTGEEAKEAWVSLKGRVLEGFSVKEA